MLVELTLGRAAKMRIQRIQAPCTFWNQCIVRLWHEVGRHSLQVGKAGWEGEGTIQIYSFTRKAAS